MAVDWTPERIRLLIEQRGENITTFARSMHVTRNAVQKWLRGDRRPDGTSRTQMNRLYAGLKRRKTQK